MQKFADLHFKPQALAHYGLPDIPYPVPVASLQAAVSGDGELPLAVMLHGLQQRSRDDGASWQASEPARDRLAELLSPTTPVRSFQPLGSNAHVARWKGAKNRRSGDQSAMANTTWVKAPANSQASAVWKSRAVRTGSLPKAPQPQAPRTKAGY